jgi:bifunctional UDP-N-acetylglucosamine pyrophosphorylase/glucosamine-1-phosphate N-acetyltransferase
VIKYIDKKNTYIDKGVVIGDNTTIYPNVMIEGKTIIGKNVVIHMGSYIKDSTIGDNTVIYNSQIRESIIGQNNHIGPYANIREKNNIGNNIKIGSFVELKNNVIKDNSKIPHLSYIGDSDIGENVNIGCGVITANYDGKNKYKTIIKDDAFIGCNVNLVAPVVIEENALIAAGSTITEDVPANALAIARARQTNKEDYNK